MVTTAIANVLGGFGIWAWTEFHKDFLQWFKELANRQYNDEKEKNEKFQEFERHWIDFQWGEASKRYQKRMMNLYGFIRALGATEPMPLNDIYTDVYILEKPLAFQRYDISQLYELQKEPDNDDNNTNERLSGLRVVIQERGRRLFILGKPGAGKTTFLKYLVHQTMVEGLNKIPIFITIKDWADSNLDLLDFIVSQFDICSFPKAGEFIEFILRTDRAILLFDGLDEVRKENQQQQQAVVRIRDFCRKYNDSQAIVTCRIAALDYSFEQFTYIEMADFNDQQVKTYARKWFRDDAQRVNQFLDELYLPENKGVRDLGRSPLLLSLICLAFNETLHIPQRRVELYEEALDALLKKWDSSRLIRRDEIYHKLSLGRKKQMFARIAAESFDEGKIFFQKCYLITQIVTYLQKLPPVDASDDPDGDSVLNAIVAQHGIFIERAQNIFAFTHLTFQEYYTAKYIVDNSNLGALNGLMLHITDARWREVFLLTASLLHEADYFFEIMQKNINALFEGQKSLLAIQRDIEKKVGNIEGFQPGALRSIYWIYSLDQAKALPGFSSSSSKDFGSYVKIVLGDGKLVAWNFQLQNYLITKVALSGY